jgi:hypothetical protein
MTTGHASRIESDTRHPEAPHTALGDGSIYRAVCTKGCGRGKWRTLKTAAQTDARQHAHDTAEPETYASAGGTDR